MSRVVKALVATVVFDFGGTRFHLYGSCNPNRSRGSRRHWRDAVAWLNGRLSKDNLEEALDDTVQLTTMVVFLLIGSTAFTLVFRGLYGDIWIEDFLVNLPGGKWGLIVISQLVIFVLGFFIDFFEIAFILLPLLVPAAKLLGIDLVWFAVLMAMNLQTSFLTPPFGFSLFYLRGWLPKR